MAGRTATEPSGAVRAYMALYNILQLLGWSYILFCTVTVGRAGGGSPGVWQAVQLPLKIFQTAAVLEVFHCLLGFVRAPVATTAIQVASRVWVLWGIVNLVPEDTMQGSLRQLGPLSPTLTSLVVAWSLSEIIRYGFFAAKALGMDSYILLWLRYSAFLVLYPVGVGSELTMAALALSQIKRRKLLTWELPNALNQSFDYYTACIAAMLVYLPGFPHMFYHMLRQRQKNLGSSARPKQA